jgi:hypothetical protein
MGLKLDVRTCPPRSLCAPCPVLPTCQLPTDKHLLVSPVLLCLCVANHALVSLVEVAAVVAQLLVAVVRLPPLAPLLTSAR